MKPPKDYLTDRLAQFDKQFVAQQGKKKVWWVDDPLRVKAFLTETIHQSMEVGRDILIEKVKKLKKQEETKDVYGNIYPLTEAGKDYNKAIDDVIKALS